MIFLTEEYWSNMTEENTNDKGICFEKLVENLLIAEYGKAVFQGTRASWDGSKDFYYYSHQNKYWAECKNYTSSIDLKVLASTLVMAQLSEIDTILYYSYSAINVNTKAKLLLSASRKGKNVYFYDDTVLEQKIFQYWDCIGEIYFPEFSKEDISFENLEHNIESKCLLYGTPLDLGAAIAEYEVKHLTLFKMFEMDICIINRTQSNNKINFGFKKLAQLKAQFDVYPEYQFRSKTEIILGPYEGKVIRLWLVPLKENCTLPNPCINGKSIGLPKNVEFKALQSRRNSRLIGKSYDQILTNFKKNVLSDNVKLKICVFYGNSGTGKSKLFQECLNSSKISGYDIVEFGNLNNSKSLLSTQDFIQKLLVAIYSISLDMLEEIIKEIKFQGNNDLFIKKQPEYHMLADVFSVTDTVTMQKWINQYIDLIVVKLAKCKFLIAIDNVQFLDNEIIDLLDFICTKLINIKPCNTKFLFTFNVDYIKKDSKASQFLSQYTSDDSLTCAEHITGFKSSQECYEFLQESFSIGEVFQRNDIEYIVKNLNRNPFYLEQMIYWLQEKQVLESREGSYKISDHIAFDKLIRNIPNTVYKILLERWNYYQKNYKSEIEKVTILFSAIHLYNELTKREIDELKISWEIITELESMGFITIEDTLYHTSVSFQHDLIDNFFAKIYPSFSKQAITYENKMNIVLRCSDTRNFMGKLYSDENNCLLTNSQISEILSVHVDGRLCYEFYLLVFEKILDNFEHNYSDNKTMCINNIYQAMVFIHDILGNYVMEKNTDKLLYKLKNIHGLFDCIEYGKLLLYISEAYDSMGKYQEAVRLIKDYLDNAFGKQIEKSLSIEQQKIISQIYNRLHVYYRHQVATPLENKDIMDYLNKSSYIANNIQDAVMQYVNYSDRGYLYYDLPLSDNNHNKTILYWEKACNIYEKGNAEAKYINYLRKKTQLSLLEGDSEKAVHAAERGLEEIDISPYAYQQTFFKWWFYHALAEAYLLCYKNENAEAIEKSLERANFYSDLLTSNKRFYYLQLKSVYMYYLKRYDNAIELNNEAIKLVESSNYKLKKASIKKQLSENEFILKSILREPQHNLYSQIHTTDGLFNLPCM
ncbi:tetratricopeptide repeat protein [Waltera sp.]|jgi:hypothetical protein|uniref:tetratricopeptide repeat protein n=1 Tax=Waltera sp. TaxID=2815806 RepID=UPI0039942D84